MSVLLELENIRKSYGEEVILEDLSLEVKKNEFLTLLGPSGCGKTTTLRIIGGFENPDSGRILLDGQDITYLEAYDRPINTVFQKYALFPHLNVFENIAFGLRIRKFDQAAIKNRVGEVLSIVNLSGYEKRAIDALSGGQQQRVAIARALVNNSQLILLDEPLGALDLKLRKEMQLELKKIQRSIEATFIYVTHDQEEALTMSDKIVVLKEGNIQQIGSPIDIYNEPANAFVADFIGESNILQGRMKEDYRVEFLGRVFDCVDHGFEKDEEVDIVIRPEDIVLSKNSQDIQGQVKSVVFKGVHYEMEVDFLGFLMIVQSTVHQAPGEEVGLSIAPDLIHVMRRSE